MANKVVLGIIVVPFTLVLAPIIVFSMFDDVRKHFGTERAVVLGAASVTVGLLWIILVKPWKDK